MMKWGSLLAAMCGPLIIWSDVSLKKGPLEVTGDEKESPRG